VKIKQTEQSMLKAVHNYFVGDYKYCLKNSYIFRYDWESDYFCINKEGYSFEIEVKISKADYKNDFKKDKHQFFKFNANGRLIPNRFYYAVPEGLITEKDLPPYAGLIEVKNGHATIVKRAPFIHRDKFDFRKILCDKFYNIWMINKRNHRQIKYDHEGLKNRLRHLNIWKFTADKKDWELLNVDFKKRIVTGMLEPYYEKKKNWVKIDTEEIKEFPMNEVEFVI
jgi:hypothetical protein